MLINSLDELYIGLTDLPIAFIALLFGILLLKKHNTGKRYFFLIAAGAFMGSCAHALNLAQTMYKLIWFVLYIILFEIVRCVAGVLIKTISENISYKKPLFLGEILLFIITIAFLMIGSPLDIYFFVGYACLSILFIIWAIIKYSLPKEEVLLIAFCVLAAVCQSLKTIIPYGIIWGHAAIIVALFFFYKFMEKH